MEEQEVKTIFAEVGAILTDDHFVYSHWDHGSVYVNKNAIYPYTEKVACLCRDIAGYFMSDKVDVVVAPAVGGIALSQWTAHQLGGLIGKRVLAAFAEKSGNNGGFEIKRGYNELVAGKNILVVEDILNTGSSAAAVVEAVRNVDGKVIGVGALCNRNRVTAGDLGNIPKLHSLINLKVEKWNEGECPLCQAGVPVNEEFGRGREFMDRKRAMSSV